jgi:hypothetical protein
MDTCRKGNLSLLESYEVARLQNLPVTENSSVPYGSFIGRFRSTLLTSTSHDVLKYFDKIQVPLKSEKNNGYFT